MRCDRVVVVSGGTVSRAFLQKNIATSDLIIAADQGVMSLLAAGIIPHVAIGDFDTVGKASLDQWRSAGMEIILLPANKDMTDTHAALAHALKYEPNEIYLYGAFGGARQDHTLANVALLEWLDSHRIKGFLEDETNRMQLLHGPAAISLHHSDFRYISLLAVSERLLGVTTTGLAYELQEAILVRGDSLGLSNKITEKTATIHIDQGLGLVIESRDQ